MIFGGRTTRRRGAGAGPAPTLTTLRRTALTASYGALLGGGDAFTANGADFVSGAVIELTNLSTSAVTNVSTTGSGTSLACTLPVLTEGDYSGRIKNPDGQYSTTNLPLAVVRLPESIANVKGAYSQRGDANDYVPTGTTTAPVWKDRTNNANHIVGQNVAANQAPLAPAPLDGKSAIRRTRLDGKDFPNQAYSPSAFFTTTGMSVLQVALLRANATATNQAATTSTTYPSPQVTTASAGGAYSTFHCGSANAGGGKVSFGGAIYDSGWETVNVIDAPGGVVSAQLLRHDGATIKVAQNALPSTGVSKAALTKGFAEASASYKFQFQADSSQDSDTYALYMGVMTEAEMLSILRFERFYNLPSGAF